MNHGQTKIGTRVRVWWERKTRGGKGGRGLLLRNGEEEGSCKLNWISADGVIRPTTSPSTEKNPRNHVKPRSTNTQVQQMPQQPGTKTVIPTLPMVDHITKFTKKKRELTGNKVHRDQYGTERGQLWEDIIDLVVRVRHFDWDLCEVIRVRAR